MTIARSVPSVMKNASDKRWREN